MNKKIAAIVVLAFAAVALAAAPTLKRVNNVTTTSQTVYMPLGYSFLECTSKVHYKVVSASDGTAATTDSYVAGLSANGFMDGAWVNIESDRYLALIKPSTGVTAKCRISQPSADGQTASFTTLTATGAVTLDSTLSVDLGATFGTIVSSPILDGGAIIGTTLNTSGATVLGGAVTTTGPNTLALYTSLQDAGVNNATVTGNSTIAGTLGVTGTITATGGLTVPTTVGGTCTLDGASPSVCTATVLSGSTCVVSNTGTATNGVKGAVASTTLTVTGPNGATDVVAYLCAI